MRRAVPAQLVKHRLNFRFDVGVRELQVTQYRVGQATHLRSNALVLQRHAQFRSQEG